VPRISIITIMSLLAHPNPSQRAAVDEPVAAAKGETPFTHPRAGRCGISV